MGAGINPVNKAGWSVNKPGERLEMHALEISLRESKTSTLSRRYVLALIAPASIVCMSAEQVAADALTTSHPNRAPGRQKPRAWRENSARPVRPVSQQAFEPG
jgi:hypothetical protein